MTHVPGGILYPDGQVGPGLEAPSPGHSDIKAVEKMDRNELDAMRQRIAASVRAHAMLAEAGRPDIDPCIVAEEAMPGYLFGELNPSEQRWLIAHIEGCTWCSRIFASFGELNAALDEIDAEVGARTPPSVAGRLGLKEACYGQMETPVGPLLVAVSDGKLCATSWIRNGTREAAIRDLEARGFLAVANQDAVAPVIDQLNRYFEGAIRGFDIEIDLSGVSEFTHKALIGIRDIAYGDVKTYGDVARKIGQPGATQAVGNAMGRNPIPIVIPCHRVVRSDGSMGHYTGGADIKEALLAIEG
ncbi:MAG TPA: methylated-DNA--[protein]-cysteine S-methyltransferase, partial [Thermomicrobiales bacterium]|nr:methylated-DNA--[protein]-cysteine S-methyltransferase [Thermomicrobiales bacterium]